MSTPDVPAQGAPAPIAPLAPSGSVPQAPTPLALAPVLPAPPDISKPASLDAPAPTPGEDHSPPGLADTLGNYFGVDPKLDAAGQDAVLQPMLQTLVDSGKTPPPPVAQQQQVSNQPAHDPSIVPVAEQVPAVPVVPVVPAEFDVNSFDFGETPGVKEAFTAMQAQNAAAIAAANQQTALAQKSAADAQVSFQQQQTYLSQQDDARMADRASVYLDGLSNPLYGVGENRTMIQQVATNKLLDVASSIARGITAHNGPQPSVEKLLEMAVLYSASPPVVPTANVPNVLTPGYSPQGPAPAAPAQHAGSAGAGGSLMDDASFMEGARAILNR